MDLTQADWTAKPRSAQLEFRASVGADVAAARLRGHAYTLPCDAWIGDQAPGGVTLSCTLRPSSLHPCQLQCQLSSSWR